MLVDSFDSPAGHGARRPATKNTASRRCGQRLYRTVCTMASKSASLQGNENTIVKRKARLETRLTSGLGFGNSKKQQIELFWNTVWPKLAYIGWQQVRSISTFLFYVPKF